ncbi:hypothetical protein ANN_27405 [Periplaneta americana]|uniref:C2H2-type domain-containing protein n=1 Tax=Periplaneta americana TaxID=6978 RepID=A0ABQ8RVV8_PERAM|nr:hypothetical protein ANN_27405 [Periplaneta americana]
MYDSYFQMVDSPSAAIDPVKMEPEISIKQEEDTTFIAVKCEIQEDEDGEVDTSAWMKDEDGGEKEEVEVEVQPFHFAAVKQEPLSDEEALETSGDVGAYTPSSSSHTPSVEDQIYGGESFTEEPSQVSRSPPPAVDETPPFINEDWKCVICDKQFLSYDKFHAHKYLHAARNFKCGICGKAFLRPSLLAAHERTHTGEKPYKCDMCEKGFSQQGSLIVHKRIHTGEKPHKCSSCDKSFTQRTHLLAHERTHTGEKSFMCHVCGKHFTSHYTLVSHLRIHSGQKPYKCDLCQKDFSTHKGYIVHGRTHTGEKPFACEVCGKAFYMKVSLFRHIRTHTGEKTYTCNVCQKAFSRRDYLVKHERGHIGEKPFKCNICGKDILHYRNYCKHVRRHESKFIPQGATVDKILYKEILGRISNSIRRKRPELWHRKNWLLLHDNAPAHRSILVQEELARQQVAVLPHPPYSPDLAPCDFFSLSPHEINPGGRNFYAAEKVMTATREAVRHLPANIFQRCFQQLHKRWQTCIAPTATILREDVDLFKCTPYHAASSETSRFLWVPTLEASVSELNDCTTYTYVFYLEIEMQRKVIALCREHQVADCPQSIARLIGDNAGEMSPGSNTESYPAFAHIGLRENPGKNLNQVTCPDWESNPGHLVSRPDVLTVTPQV